jgi:hypothetical protein
MRDAFQAEFPARVELDCPAAGALTPKGATTDSADSNTPTAKAARGRGILPMLPTEGGDDFLFIEYFPGALSASLETRRR